MERCYFAKSPPKVEVRGELVFVIPECGDCEFAITPRTLGKFVAAANRALDEIYERRSAEVVKIGQR